MADPALIRVIDVETSGLPEDESHGIVEIAWVDVVLPSLALGTMQSHLADPGHPIPAHVRAIHHIGDADVAGKTTSAEAAALALKDLPPDAILCAHNAVFEQAFVATEIPWLCTLKISLRAWPSFQSHSNQALRYELGLDTQAGFDAAAAFPPHRALPDAYVTAHILRRLMTMGRPISRLLEISAEPEFHTVMTFGKHRGEPYAAVADNDPSYLTWVIDKSDLDEGAKFSAAHWLRRAQARREAQVPA